MISSVSNAKIKNVMQLNQKAKARREQGLFVAEGRKMFLEAPEEWVSQVFVSESFSQDGELMAQVEKYPYEIVKKEEIPEKLKEEIAEAEKSEMWISYADTGNEGRYLYIVRGYGRQETTGYSIEVNECYETEHTLVVRTTLLGPQKKEKTQKKKTYPYIVIKIPYTDKQIIYE